MMQAEKKILDPEQRAKIIDVARRMLAKEVGGETEHERDTAKRLLDKYLAKYGLTRDEIKEKPKPVLPVRTFGITHPDDEFILINVVLSINPFAQVKFRKRAAMVELDDEDYKEVVHKFKHFLELWNMDREMLTMAFFSKHAVHFSPDEHTKEKLKHKMAKPNPFSKAQEEAINLQEMANKGANQWNDLSQAEKMRLLNMRRKDKLIHVLMNSNYKPTR